jgi:sigma-B regulation protein RsbU (phosphoserine phosphatase)
MTELNTNLYERLEGEKYATGIFMVYDKEKESLEYTNAGHSAILLYKRKEDSLLELSEAGMPIGIMQDSKYEKGEFKFEQEDLILLQTDGVFETRNDKGEMFLLEGVKQLLFNLKDQEVAEINKTIISEVEKFQGGGPQQDDITLIALRKTN